MHSRTFRGTADRTSDIPDAMTTRKKTSETEANLRVAIRVRPMNSTERNERSTNIVKVDPVLRTLSLKGKPFGPFFRTFDSHTTQMEIYDDLVSSQIKKVIAGFNCTVFAYGQTGTGKTYTMEGGRSDAKCCQDDPSTGIVPRAVEDIFEQLEASGCEEFSLRVSYVELYNEELIDLLSSGEERLRIFDDPNKKGVIVSGVEEVPVRNRSDVFKLLVMGAEKRKTAATLMNMNSSRSHSLFMVNVVVRENTVTGEELVKQGKLNLVDLAGSENIGRSGAQGNRAKEAGSINQSLLTLGRVIRSLTTKAQHIPYRESKLTRLLQDSLGGSTITSLIATISPSSSNFEESQSTLEYAVQAANIKNKPVCNSKVSKKTILKEYSDEIEKLRRDLRAAREKNGVIISEESHEEFQRNAEKVLELEQQLDNEVDRLQRFTEDLMHMDEQYKQIYQRKEMLEDRLRERLREMAEKEKELADTKDELCTYMKALGVMHTAALKSFDQLIKSRDAAQAMQTDLFAFWKKVDEMKTTGDQNQEKTVDFVDSMKLFISQMSDQLDQLKNDGLAQTNIVVESSCSISHRLSDTSKQIGAHTEELKESTTSCFQKAADIESAAAAKTRALSEELKQKWDENLNQCREFYEEHTKLSEEGISTMLSRLDQVKEQLTSFTDDVRPLIAEVRGKVCDNVTARQEKGKQMVDDVKTTSTAVAEQLKTIAQNVMEQIGLLEKMSSRVELEQDSLVVLDQCAQESILDCLATVETNITSVEDEVGETCDVEESVKEIRQSMQDCAEKVGETLRQGAENSTNIKESLESVTQTFVSECDENRKSGNDAIVKGLNNLLIDSEKCLEASADIRTVSDKANEALSTIFKDLEATTAKTIADASESANEHRLELVDPNDNAPARVIPKFPEQHELVSPPTPDVLISTAETVGNDSLESPEVRAKKKRRVTTYVRRDSLLDSTNFFPSPATILKKREQEIDEEDIEN